MSNAVRRWLRAAALAGAIYFAAGVAPSALAGVAASESPRIWNWAAFLVCALAFAAHVAHEHWRTRGRARATAWHAAVGVALGAFALALAANVHELGTATSYRPRMLVALVAWPTLTAVPAFLVAFAAAAGFARKERLGESSS